MSVSSWLSWTFWRSHARRVKRRSTVSRPKKARLLLELLESRVTPSFGLSSLGFFNGPNGESPQAGLIMDGGGNLYGTTQFGSANGQGGAVFELAKGSDTITVLASFNGANGNNPQAGLIMDSSGNLYGTTYLGGDNLDGTVFKLVKGSSTITSLLSFNGANGNNPQAGLIMDSSGNLYGTTGGGGANGAGTVFEVAAGSGIITVLASFDGTNGTSQVGLIMDSRGNLYGTTSGGGANGDGTVFELAKGRGTITVLASFNGANGASPSAGVIMDSSGNLYGTTSAGGANGQGAGTVFELAKGSGAITSLASFNGSNGYDPVGGLIMDGSGNLYGTTSGGGANGYGTVFELLPHTPALSWNAPAAVTYGTALSSTQLDAGAADSVTGAAVAGTFVYTPAAGTIVHAGFQTLSVTFTPTDTTDYSPITTTVALVVHQATSVLTWNTPAPITAGTLLSSVQLDATAADSTTGSPVSGTFAYTPPAGTIVGRGTSTLNVTFTPNDTTDYTTANASVTLVVGPSSGLSTLGFINAPIGASVSPVGSLIMDSSGNLYGTTSGGGANGDDGTIFELANGSSTITTLASFNGSNGSYPVGGLIMDGSGNLYGTTKLGGASASNTFAGYGTVFELAKGSGTITVLASFNRANGYNPQTGLIMDSSGNLYGTAYYGGANGYGTVFELAKGSGTITTLASFNGANGANPQAGLIMDSSGNLYGTAYYGGAGNAGTVFELAKGSGTITVLASFNGANGANPQAGLIMDSSGNLYGTTSGGGATYGGVATAYGTVFELAKGSGTITTLASFNGANGAGPQAALIMDSSGNLYGTAEAGGAHGGGTVFELAKGSGTLSTLVSFNYGPENGQLIMDSSGNLYGTYQYAATYITANYVDGTVFEVLPHTPALSWSGPTPITYGTALSSTQLDASAADSGTGAAVAGTFVYTPAAGTIPHGGWQTLTVTFTPADTADYSPITTRVALFVQQVTPVLAWNTPAPITYGTALSSTQLDATAADRHTGSPLTGTFAYTPPAGTIAARGTTTMNVIFTPTDTTDYTTAKASVTLVVTPSYAISPWRRWAAPTVPIRLPG